MESNHRKTTLARGGSRVREYEPADTKSLDIHQAALASGVEPEAVHQLIVLRMIKPVAQDPDRGPMLGAEQVPLLEVLSAMSTLNFRLEEMRAMVAVLETLGTAPRSERAEKHRLRLAAFVTTLQRRTAVTAQQVESKRVLLDTLTDRHI
jgi:DNA-binding transcriptional MerR regulator